MGQRTQIHIRKDNKFYVVLNQFGAGKDLVYIIEELIKAKLLEQNTKIESVFKKLKLKNLDFQYLSVEVFDNDNGYFLLDLDNKIYCLLAGVEELNLLDVSLLLRKRLSIARYLLLFCKYEYETSEIFAIARACDEKLIDSRFKLIDNYKYNHKTKKLEKYKLEDFLKASRKFFKIKENTAYSF